ncbi:TAXI family TRAP transporter solute-binding subunit [Nocardia terpenica]|uniref:TAXI family TRAP transporter solute-binding subunit n=1 Tax=Nocardia terpenica TaxID=455432 RepID=UPI002FE0C546
MNRRALLTAAAAGVLLAGCGRTRPPRVRLADGEVGGFYHAFTTLLAQAAAEAGTVAIEPVSTAGSSTNLAMLDTGAVDAALTLADSVDGHSDRLLALGRVYENYLQLAVRRTGPITRIADLRGARISLGAAGSGAARSGDRLLRAADLDPATDVTVVHLPLPDAVAAITDGAVDALLWAGGVPTAALDIPRLLRLIDLGELAAPMRARFGYLYDRVLIPADVYPATPAVHTIGIANLLVTTAALPDPTAAALTELLLTRADHLIPTEAAGTQFLDQRALIGTDGLSLHPAAARVYRHHHG